jgi:hypothetical protein
MAVNLKGIQTQILGAALIELLNGQLSDETIAAVDSIKREDVQGPLNNLVGMMHGMSTHPPLRESQISSLVDEIRIAAIEALEPRREHPTPLGFAWTGMYSILEELLGRDPDPDPSIAIHEGIDKEMLPPIEQAPTWAQPMIKYAHNTELTGDELTLHLLEMLEVQIQNRKAELLK